ncbi:MAG: L-2-hydroxyglutarate oxidase [Nitrospinaceae bacterium]
MTGTDFLIIGGGVIGINIARELKKREPEARVVVVEKEPDCGFHASGRNSGVLHAGFYYSADSLKARFTRIGNQLLTEYCEQKNIRINKCGKLVVAKNEGELASLDELVKRGKKNRIRLEEITEKEAREIEPRVKTHERALFSPTTSSVDPLEVLQAMKQDALQEGIRVETGVRYLKREGKKVVTSSGDYEARYVVNSAGLYADQIAQDFGFSRKYRILPFKGLYLYSSDPKGSVRTNIYPVPDLRNPFLGVHYTLTVDGRVKIGPTAIPAFWREQYSGVDNFYLSEFIEIIFRQLGLFTSSNFDFKKLAYEEIRKYSKSRMVSLASSLMRDVKRSSYRKWGKPGIRAQLLNIRDKKLEMDFVLEGDHESLHVLNAVSPAFTCSIPFSRYVCDEIHRLSN